MTTKKKTKTRSKAVYHVRNWSEYDKALVNRYSLTMWISEDVQKNWKYCGPKQRGAQYEYTDQAIESMLILKELFHLTNRGVEGFVRSLFELIKINLPVPDHTTLSSRGLKSQVLLGMARTNAAQSYDTCQVYDTIQARAPDARIIIPPRKNARIWQYGNFKAAPLSRDDNLRAIRIEQP